MLVLSRQRDETIVILVPDQEPIRITVVDIRGDKVRLGIDAERHIHVHREEIYEAIKRGGKLLSPPDPETPGNSH